MSRKRGAELFDDEWTKLKGKRQEDLQVRYTESGVVERLVFLIFEMLYAAVLVKALFFTTSPTLTHQQG